MGEAYPLGGLALEEDGPWREGILPSLGSHSAHLQAMLDGRADVLPRIRHASIAAVIYLQPVQRQSRVEPLRLRRASLPVFISASYRDFPDFTSAHSLDRCGDLLHTIADQRPVRVEQHHNPDLPLGEILLMAEALVRGHQHLISIGFRCVEQFAVAPVRPTLLGERINRVLR